MSASREKARRKDDRNSGRISETPNKMSRQTKTTIIAITSLVTAFILFLVILGSGIPQQLTTIVTAGSVRLSVAEFNYFYKTAINNYLYTMQQSGYEAEFSASSDLSQIDSPYGMTWKEYFVYETTYDLRSLLALVNEAGENGHTLSDNARETIDKSIESLKESIKSAGNSVGAYLASAYGKGTTIGVIKRCYELQVTAEEYNQKVLDSYNITDAEIDAEYEANKSTYDFVDTRYFDFLSADSEDEEENAKAKNLANEFLRRYKAGEDFDTLAYEYAPEETKEDYAEPDSTLTEGASGSSFAAYKEEWLFDESRKPGDTAVIENDSGTSSVMLFIKRYRNEDKTINVRHILIQPRGFDDYTDTDEDWEAANVEALRIYGEYADGGEERFAELANQYSVDGGSNTKGGLYEKVEPGTMIAEFNDWCFDPERKPGDTGIVKTDYGYHIMYYVSDGPLGWRVEVLEALKTARHNTFAQDTVDKFPMEVSDFGASMLD